jgi:hypothetical protein
MTAPVVRIAWRTGPADAVVEVNGFDLVRSGCLSKAVLYVDAQSRPELVLTLDLAGISTEVEGLASAAGAIEPSVVEALRQLGWRDPDHAAKDRDVIREADQRAELLRRQVDELTRERDELASEAAAILGPVEP